MGTKDIITIGLSLLALVLSVIATVGTIAREKSETVRAVRSQLTDVMGRLVSLNFLEQAKLLQDAKGKDLEYQQRIQAGLQQQNQFLLGQAIALIAQLPDKLVTSVEYNTVGRWCMKANQE
ncbi:hypothetical protein HYR54_13615 [Candidatus Acetothermia bacterium]|nr:hypothetical protein [Candidatus Acetothermia bacterium]